MVSFFILFFFLLFQLPSLCLRSNLVGGYLDWTDMSIFVCIILWCDPNGSVHTDSGTKWLNIESRHYNRCILYINWNTTRNFNCSKFCDVQTTDDCFNMVFGRVCSFYYCNVYAGWIPVSREHIIAEVVDIRESYCRLRVVLHYTDDMQNSTKKRDVNTI